MDFLPLAQPRVLSEPPPEAELLSTCLCLEVSDAQIRALLNKMLALFFFFFEEVQNVFASNKPVCESTTVLAIYSVFNSDDYKKREAQQLHQGLSQMPVNSSEIFLSTSEDLRSGSTTKLSSLTVQRASLLLSKYN